MRAWLILAIVGFALAVFGRVNHLVWSQEGTPSAKDPLSAPAAQSQLDKTQSAEKAKAETDNLIAKGEATTVLAEDFADDRLSGEWSHWQTSQTPTGAKIFLGEFGSEVVTLVVRGLPEHKMIRITFDLYVIRSWDGSNTHWGPDIWQLSMFNGPTLIRTTFNNCGRVGSTPQAYPDNYPCPSHDAWTGAKEKETLGYDYDFWKHGAPVIPCNAVYHIDAVAPHEEAKIAFQFAAFYNDRTLKNQSWGLANLKVQTVDSLQTISDEQLKDCWNMLTSEDAVEAVQAMWRMVAAGDDATHYISKALNLDGQPGEVDAWQLRRAKRALGIINTPAARHALWVLSEPGKYDTDEQQYSDWEMHPSAHVK